MLHLISTRGFLGEDKRRKKLVVKRRLHILSCVHNSTHVITEIPGHRHFTKFLS